MRVKGAGIMSNTLSTIRTLAVACQAVLAAAIIAPSSSLAGPPGTWGAFAPFVFGEATNDDLVIFTAPSCPYCRMLMDQIPALSSQYRVIVLPISFSGYDAQRVRALACAADQDAAAQTLLLHQDILLPQKEPCDLRAVQARYQEATRLGVTMVPVIIRSDGGISRGWRPDLADWLARGTSR